ESFSNPSTFSFANCQFHGGKFDVQVPSLFLTNCLFERVNTTIGDDSIGADISPIIRNCLFFGGKLNLTHWNSDTWLFRDNAFDRATIVQEGDIDNAYDGYTTGSNRLTPNDTVNDVITSTLVWQSGFLGRYYQPINSQFINKGSTYASSVGLYHFTVTTNLIAGIQIKETNSIVDIGFHYVATDSTGQPLDSDSDGLPDYVEDANGNGIMDPTESDLTKADTDGDGLSDKDELQHHSDPNLVDSDYDGVTDAQEVADKTDPLNSSSVR